jgi:hypothetical protein
VQTDKYMSSGAADSDLLEQAYWKICAGNEYSRCPLLRYCLRYSGCTITLSLDCVTVGGEGKMKRAWGSKTAKSLSQHVQCN